MSSAEVVRSLKIKTATLRRIHKELSYYQAEAEKEHVRVEAMKAAAADAHDLRQAVSPGRQAAGACWARQQAARASQQALIGRLRAVLQPATARCRRACSQSRR